MSTVAPSVPPVGTPSSPGWERVEPKLGATAKRRRALQREADHYHFHVPYGVDRNSLHVEIDGERYLMMSSYSYLGLNGDDRIVAAAAAATDTYGTGTHGVRLLAGTLPLHRELEETLARLGKREDAIVFGSGYGANVGTIEALCGPRDQVFLDKIDHASIMDGAQLCGAKVSRFRHNDPEDLDRRLRAAPSGPGPDGPTVRLVVVDSVYSMDGDIAPLPELREVCDRHEALLMVDEAHALGVIGPSGLGIEDHYGRSDLVDIKMGTLSKGIPSVGGYVSGPAALIEHLKHRARPFVFSAALAPAQAAAALESLRILEAEPSRVTHTQTQADRLRDALNAAGVPTGRSSTAVIPLVAGSDEAAYDFATACLAEGIVALPVVSPAVPTGAARLRVAVTAGHSAESIDVASAGFVAAAVRCGVVKAGS